jgi:polysaccharide export outer membrane protein
MTNSKRAAKGSSRVTSRLFFVSMGLALASVAAAQGTEKLSLRLSSELTLGAAPASVPVAAPAIAPSLTAIGPVNPRDYRIGPDDLLEIQVFGVDQLTRSVRVNARGMVSLPLIGNLEVGGLTAQQAESLIVKRLGESYLQDPQVSLFIKEYTSQRVIIEGAVNKPGVYPLRGPTTLLQSLAVAGGQANLSDMTEVMLFRADATGRREALVYDVDRIRSGELDDPTVINDDLIVVKRSKARVFFKDSIIRDMIDTVNPFR